MSIKIKGNPLMCPVEQAALDGKVNKAGDTMSGALLVPYTRLTGIVGTDYKGLVDFGYTESDDSYLARIGYHEAYGLYVEFDNGSKTLKFPNASGTLFSSAGGTFIGDVTIDGKVLIVQNGDAYVRLFADLEGGNIRMQKSLNTYWEIDTQPAEALRFYRMANGVNTCAITLPNKSGKIALEITRTSVSPAAVSVSNSAGTAIASITLDPGMWLIIGRGMFAANSTGSRQLKLSETSNETGNSVSAMTSLGASPGTLIAEVTWTFSNTSAKTIYLNAWQNSGGSLSIQGAIIALKIG